MYDPTNIDLREELREFMQLHGYWAVLRRKAGSKKADPFDTETEEGSSQGGVLAAGENYIDYFVKVRRTALIDRPEQSTSIGLDSAQLVRFYLRFRVKPDPHDFILEIAQDESSLVRSSEIQPVLPVKITKIWDIQEVTPMRDQGGRIEFWQVLAKEATTGDA